MRMLRRDVLFLFLSVFLTISVASGPSSIAKDANTVEIPISEPGMELCKASIEELQSLTREAAIAMLIQTKISKCTSAPSHTSIASGNAALPQYTRLSTNDRLSFGSVEAPESISQEWMDVHDLTAEGFTWADHGSGDYHDPTIDRAMHSGKNLHFTRAFDERIVGDAHRLRDRDHLRTRWSPPQGITKSPLFNINETDVLMKKLGRERITPRRLVGYFPNVLMMLYDVADGPNWFNSEGWGSETVSYCEWPGIICYNCDPIYVESGDCPVQLVWLFDNNLRGDVKDILQATEYLTYVTSVQLDDNQIYGTLPDPDLPFVYSLDVSLTHVSGPIPEFSKMPNMVFFIARGSQLSGEIPTFKYCPNFLRVDLSFSTIRANIPTLELAPTMQAFMANHANMQGILPVFSAPSLRVLYLAGSNIEGPIVLTNLTNLLHLEVSSNNLREFPDVELCPQLMLFNVESNLIEGPVLNPSKNMFLQFYYVGFNYLTGTFPDLQLPNLIVMSMAGNLLSGNMPSLDGCPQLQQITATDNFFSGSFPSMTLPNMLNLFMGENFFTGELPDLVMPRLFYFDIEKNYFTGNAHLLENCLSLRYLKLSSNRLNGLAPTLKSPSLSHAILSHSNITGTLPSLQDVPFLEYIDLSYNSVTGVDWSAKMTYVKAIILSHNRISGTLERLENLPELIELQLSSNQLEGTIPAFAPVNLGVLDLRFNRLTGSLPSFNVSQNLQRLDVSYNLLSGTLPKLNRPFLKTLDASGNQITGQIPDFNLPSLYLLSLSNNRLTGTIPNFSDMASLNQLRLQQNNLTGTIPDFTFLPDLSTFYAGNNQLEGSVVDFSRTPWLSDLQLPQNRLSFLPDFKNLRRVEILNVQANRIRQPFPDLSLAPYLKQVVLDDNLFYGTIPLLSNEYLVELRLSTNKFFGSLPQLSQLPNLQVFDVSFNNISGQIPFDYGKLANIRSVSFAYNQLEGWVDSTFWGIPTLKSIDLSYNKFSGDLFKFICPEDCNLNTFESLNVAGNKLDGPLTGAIFDYMASLKNVDLSNNRISTLNEIGLSNTMQTLDVSRNPLVGHIPDSYSSFYSLLYMNLTMSGLHHGSNPLIPSFMSRTDRYLLQNEEDRYMCPTLTSTENPLVSYYVEPGYYDFEFCKCLPDYYGYAGKCLKCPQDCDCSAGSKISLCFPSPSLQEIKTIIPCPYPASCVSDSQDDPSASNCREGYEGRVCSKCQDGYGKLGRLCSECDKDGSIAIIVIVGWGFLCFVFYTFKATPKSSGRVKIFLFHIQTLSILWSAMESTEISSLVDIFSSIGSVSFPSLSCVFDDTSAEIIVLFSIVRAPIILAFGALGFLVSSGVSRDKVTYVVLLIFHTLYYGVTRDVFSAISCTLHDEGDEKTYLNIFPWIPCESGNDEFVTLLKMAIPFLIGFVAVLPISFYMILRRSSKQLDHPQVYQRYGFLFINYHHDYYYWDLVIITRRLMIALITTIIPYTEKAALYITLFVVFQLSIWLQHRYNPYVTQVENLFEISSLYVLYFSFFAGLLTTLLGGLNWIKILVIVTNAVFIFVFFIVIVVAPTYRSYMDKNTVVQATQNTTATNTQKAAPQAVGQAAVQSPSDPDA
eukprot:TRINITY_DN7023_c0_g1_i1.p1 TRINITY_DN7023_c0_g1~~TRINITY_DN7023_c0_g1_i1.p1  ORF type:complete len:1603 (+),score=320.54 TRINITY_DN7023_c0_g1_i1:254-5062(+)